MIKLITIPLVDWGMGTAIIIVFAVFCVGLSLIIYKMTQSGKNKDEKDK